MTILKRVSVISVALLSMLSSAVHAADKPNIIYILADDLGYGEIGSYGETKINTPFLDQLAKDGMRFTQHYSGSTVCAPTRSSLMEGKHTGHTAVRGNMYNNEVGILKANYPLLENSRTLGHVFKEAGYATAIYGKWGVGGITTSHPDQHGFDDFAGYLSQGHAHNHYPDYMWHNRDVVKLDNKTKPKVRTGDYNDYNGNDYVPDLMLKAAKAFVSKNQNTPFFIYYPTAIPHAALQVPEDSLVEYKGTFPEDAYTGKGYRPHAYPRAAKAAMITRMDRDIGALLAHVESLGLSDNTVVMFTSDNGPSNAGGLDIPFFNGADGLRGIKRDLYEGGIRVPFIVKWPGVVARGSISNHISAQWDMMSTFADMTGGTTNADSDGISMTPTLRGAGTQKQHETLYWEFWEKQGAQAVRYGNWKGVRVGINKNPQAPIELYDLSADVAEAHNIAADHPDIVAKIRAAMADRTVHPVKAWNLK